MKKLHISINDSIHEQLLLKASESGLPLQTLVERLLEKDLITLPLFKHAVGSNPKFTFIDLFAGIGGMRIAFESAGGRCVFTSEWDKHAQKTYLANFGDEPVGDIRKVRENEVPDHDVLVAGFPCQPFSIAGVSKKNSLGREHGFKDKTQGTLFFDVVRIIDAKRPKAFLLENVKNLVSHDKGNTFRVIKETLDELGYDIECRVVDARHYVPQHRERIFIVGFDRKLAASKDIFEFPNPPRAEPSIGAILEKRPSPKYVLSDKLWGYLQDYARKHQEKGNGFGFGLVGPKSVARTLSARYYKDGSEILVRRASGNPRRLTPRECARLMGFPEEFRICVSDTQAYKQFGNSVAVPVVSDIARAMAAHLEFLKEPAKSKSRGRLLEKEAQ